MLLLTCHSWLACHVWSCMDMYGHVRSMVIYGHKCLSIAIYKVENKGKTSSARSATLEDTS